MIAGDGCALSYGSGRCRRNFRTAGADARWRAHFDSQGRNPSPDIEDNRRQWLRGAIIEALQRVENFKLRNWSQNDTLGALIDQIEIEAKQPRLPGTLGETVRVRPEAAAEVNGLRLKPDNRNYGGPTWGALLKSIAASNSCLILLKKSLPADERNFSGPLMRFARRDVRGHNTF